MGEVLGRMIDTGEKFVHVNMEVWAEGKDSSAVTPDTVEEMPG